MNKIYHFIKIFVKFIKQKGASQNEFYILIRVDDRLQYICI